MFIFYTLQFYQVIMVYQNYLNLDTTMQLSVGDNGTLALIPGTDLLLDTRYTCDQVAMSCWLKNYKLQAW